ncbi:DUF1772 domain-containing protein [Nocardia brasiliensis]|uniref:DUF1772 domain-containing protein n=1 Tax=Nocardia brasiliensis TaxID=37326 RepID=UPI0024553D60|nr:DUF1772 domain-containing protein [Nocardia brasiliensis]
MTAFSATAVCLAVAKVGIAHEFFGHVYENIGRIPNRFAQDNRPGVPDQRMSSLLSPGSPFRYFAPAGPITVVTALGALVTGRRAADRRPWLVLTAVGVLGTDALTAYIIRVLNIPLFVAGHTVASPQQESMLRTWYRLNTVRIAVLGGAWLAATRAQRSQRP